MRFLSLSNQFRHAHRTSYRSLCLSLLFMSALVSTGFLVLCSAQKRDGAPTAVTALQHLETRAYYEGTAEFMSIMVSSCLLASLVLTVSAVGFLVQENRRQYALLYLNGGTPRQVRLMVMVTLGAPGLAAISLGTITGCGLCFPLARLLIRIGGAAPTFRVAIHPQGILLTLLFMLLALLLGILLATRRLTHVAPIEAVVGMCAPSHTIGRMRIAAAIVLGAGGLAVGFVPSGMQAEARIIVQTMLYVAATALAAPLIMPHIAVFVTALSTPFNRAAYLVARQRSLRGEQRAASVALPVIILLLVVCPFLSMMDVGTAESVATDMARIPSPLVLRSTGTGAGNTDGSPESHYTAAMAFVRNSSNVESAGVFDAERYAADTGRTVRTALVAKCDRDTLLTNLVIHAVTDGSLNDLGDDAVAVASGYGQVGDTVTLRGTDDTPHTLRIAAVFGSLPGLQPDYIALTDALGTSRGSNAYVMGYLDTGNPITVQSAWNADPSLSWAHMYTKQEFIDYYVAYRKQGRTGVSTFIAGAAFIALIALIQAVGTAVREAAPGNRLLAQICAPRRLVTAIGLIEYTADVIAAALISALVFALIWISMTLITRTDGLSLLPPIPARVFLILILACVTISAMECLAAIRRSRRRTSGDNSL